MLRITATFTLHAPFLVMLNKTESITKKQYFNTECIFVALDLGMAFLPVWYLMQLDDGMQRGELGGCWLEYVMLCMPLLPSSPPGVLVDEGGGGGAGGPLTL